AASRSHQILRGRAEAGAEAVARGEVEVALGVHAQPAAALPDAGSGAVGGGVENLLQRQVARLVADDPAVIRAVVPVGGNGAVDDAVDQGQGGALVFLQGVEGQDPVDAAVTSAGYGNVARVSVAPGGVADRHHAVGSPVQAGGDVQGVEALHVVGGAA